MNTSELLVLIFSFMVGYILFKGCGCTEGIDGDNFLDEVTKMNNLITTEINQCNTKNTTCNYFGSGSVTTGGCNENAAGNLEKQVSRLVAVSLHEGESEE